MKFQFAQLAAIVCFAIPAMSQTPSAGLTYIQTIPVPNWTNTGTTQANFDLFAFNPYTRVMYVADRTNHSVTVIDTVSNGVIGITTLPGSPSTNGVVFLPDRQALAVTDGKSNLYVFDLRTPDTAPDVYNLPNITGGTDALDYDPLNHTVYVINGTTKYLSGVDVVNKQVVSQIELPGSPELMRFNLVDGLLYQVITDQVAPNQNPGVIAYDPVSNTIKAAYPVPNCVPHGIDIDPVTNTALLGCGTNQGQIMMNLKDGSVLKAFPDVTGTDLLVFNPNNRRYYTGSGSNVSTTTGCPKDTTNSFPIVGVFDAQLQAGGPQARLIGVQCSGRNGHGLGVDTIQNFIYVGTRQYPVDANDATTGQNGVMVFYDPNAIQPLTTGTTSVKLTGIGNQAASGTLTVRQERRHLRAQANLTGVRGNTAVVALTTTDGYQVIPCGIDPTSGSTFCDGPITGDPMLGGVAVLAIDGAPAARGTIPTSSM
jgi:hypothetical protein